MPVHSRRCGRTEPGRAGWPTDTVAAARLPVQGWTPRVFGTFGPDAAPRPERRVDPNGGEDGYVGGVPGGLAVPDRRPGEELDRDVVDNRPPGRGHRPPAAGVVLAAAGGPAGHGHGVR